MSTPPASSAVPASATSNATPVNSAIKRTPRTIRVLREIVAVSFWGMLVTKVLVIDFDLLLVQRFLPNYEWMLQFKFIAVVAALALLCLCLGNRWIWNGLLYVVVYPFIVVLWYLPALLLRNWVLLVAFAPAIHAAATTFRTMLAWIAVALVGSFVIVAFKHPYFVIPSMIALGCYLLRHYVIDFKRSLFPSTVFADIAQVVRKIKGMEERPFEKQVAELAVLTPGTPEYIKKHRSAITTAYAITSLVHFLAEQLRNVNKSNYFDIYLIARFLLTFATTVMVFAMEYYGLYKVSPGAFHPSDRILGLWDFVGYSINTLMTASISPVVPLSSFAQWLGHAELFAAVTLVSIILSLFFASVRVRLREDMDLVCSELAASEEILGRQLEADFQMSEQAIEVFLVAVDLSTVNMFRQLRGLELLKPAASVSPETANQIAGAGFGDVAAAFNAGDRASPTESNVQNESQ